MADYKLIATGVRRASDGAFVPVDEGNRDWRAYQAWLEAGNAPDPADPAPEEARDPLAELTATLVAKGVIGADDVPASIADAVAALPLPVAPLKP
jgi:hypothetical protein